jgi:hypothetical protein
MPAADYRPTEIVVAPQDTRLEIEQMVLLDPAEFEVDETTPDRLSSAMLAYRLLLDQPGQRALVTIHLSDPAPEDARWLKYDAVNGWQGYSDFTAFSADRQTVTVEVKDGAFGDTDGVTNGIILIPAGLSTAEDSSSVASSSGGGGGVFDPRHLGGNGRRKSTPGNMGIYRVDPPAFQHLERLSGKEYIRCVSLSQMTALDHHFFPPASQCHRRRRSWHRQPQSVFPTAPRPPAGWGSPPGPAGTDAGPGPHGHRAEAGQHWPPYRSSRREWKSRRSGR